MDDFLRKYHSESMRRLGFKPIPKKELDAWCEYVEKFVIPKIKQRIHDRTPTKDSRVL